MKTESLQKKNSNHCKKVNAQNLEILDLRRWIAWISNIIEARRKCLSLSNKQKADLRKIKRKYDVSSTSKLKEIRDKLHCTLKLHRENNQFVSSQKNWLSKRKTKVLKTRGEISKTYQA